MGELGAGGGGVAGDEGARGPDADAIEEAGDEI